MNTQNDVRFADLGIAKNMLDVLSKKGFETPTPIQHRVIPSALKGEDVVGIAQTGTGKTLAFAIPLLQRLASVKGQGLILAPTRELALQVDSVLHDIAGTLGLRTAVIIGGAPQFRQVKALKKNPHIVVATPGRLADLIKQKEYNLKNISVVVLDEADRMLDDGFLPEIKRFLKMMPEKRHTMLFSATMPDAIATIATKHMRSPLRIEVAPQGTSAKKVTQELFVVKKPDKVRLLDQVLHEHDGKVLVFVRTKRWARKLASLVQGMDVAAVEMHGDRSLAQRRRALEGFTSGKYRVLVATDVAARGIDVNDITLVVNYDLPDNAEDYVHRIGRTARAGKSGAAISFADPSQKKEILSIERLIQKSLPSSSLPELPPHRPQPKSQHRQGRSAPRRSGGGNRRNQRSKRRR